MAILFNNPNDASKDKIPPEGKDSPSKPAEIVKAENAANTSTEDDFAIFPLWDVVPPNGIINPRIKKTL